MSFYVSVRLTRLILGSWMLKEEFLGGSSTSNSGCLGTSDQEMGSESRRVCVSGSVLLRLTLLID